MRKLSVLILSILMLTGCNANNSATVTTESEELPVVSSAEPTVEPIITEHKNNMTLEEKVGQLFMVRCDSITTNDIKNMQPGGIIMFSSDFDNLTKDGVRNKINGFNNLSNITPYIAVDEEGGTVVRVSSHKNLAPEKYESPQYYYNKGGMELVLSNAAEKSDLLLSLGINMNLAPVSDVSQDPNHFIYKRAFGKGAEETADYVKKVVEVMEKHNITSCLKHFPGYGGNIDTHQYVAIDNRPLEQFRSADFLPFEAGIDAGADFVLVAHNIVTAVDSDMPATLSKPMHDILRDELGFNGIIITDDMSMAAAANYAEPYKTAVLAGNDMIIVTDFKAAYDEVYNAVKNGEIPESVIDDAVHRILTAKKEKGLI